MMDTRETVALITGGTRGIGKQTALRLARHGVNIVVAARCVQQSESEWPGSLKQAESEIRELGVEAMAVKCDVSNRADVENLCRAALDRFGRVDFLLNHTAHSGPEFFDSFLQIGIDAWEHTVRANLMAAVIASKLILPSMIEHRRGMILCTTSGIVTHDVPGIAGAGGVAAPYPTTKAALDRFVVALAKETRQHNIPVIAVDPGATMTEKVRIMQERHGFDASIYQPMDIPAAVFEYLCCKCPNPMEFTGQVISAREFIKKIQ